MQSTPGAKAIWQRTPALTAERSLLHRALSVARSQGDTVSTRPPPATGTRHCCCQSGPGFTAKMSPLGTPHTGRFSVLSPCHEPKHPVLIPHTLPHCRGQPTPALQCMRAEQVRAAHAWRHACQSCAPPKPASPGQGRDTPPAGAALGTETLQTPSIGTRAPQRLLACRSAYL